MKTFLLPLAAELKALMTWCWTGGLSTRKLGLRILTPSYFLPRTLLPPWTLLPPFLQLGLNEARLQKRSMGKRRWFERSHTRTSWIVCLIILQVLNKLTCESNILGDKEKHYAKGSIYLELLSPG